MKTPVRAKPAFKKTYAAMVWLFRNELVTLVLLGAVAAAVWAFVEIADEVMEGETETIDERVVLAMRSADDLHDPLGPHWVEEMGRDFTALGGVGVQVCLTFGVIGALLLMRRPHAALLVLVAVGGGVLLSFLLKQGFDRPRPELVPHESYVYTSSFPSGHSMMSAVTYLTLGALLSRMMASRILSLYFIGVAALLTCAVGVSRVYLGVHYPSDVLAGWTGGIAWALLCWAVTLRLQQRGDVEQEIETEEDLQREASSDPVP